MAMNGSDFLIYANVGTPESPSYAVVGCQRDATVDEASATIDVSCKDSRNQRVLAGRYSSNVSFDALYVPDDTAFAALQAANRAGDLILIAREENGVITETANAQVTSISNGFPDQDAATAAISLTIDDGWEAVGS